MNTITKLPNLNNITYHYEIFYHQSEKELRSFNLFYFLFKSDRNSSRVFALDRIHPSIQLVVVVAPVFCTPLMTMHKWLDSIMTATPCGFKTSLIARATCFVRRSWTCSRRENISARRASFERPKTLRFGYFNRIRTYFKKKSSKKSYMKKIV